MLTALWLASAWAAKPDCDSLDLAVLQRGLDRVDQEFRDGRPRRAASLLELVHRRVPCLVEPATPEVMARYAVLRAVDASIEQDRAWMERWIRAATWVDPDHAWPDYVGPTHPVRALEVEPGSLAPVAPVGRGLAPPAGGGILISGVWLALPELPSEIPVLRQVLDAERQIVDAGWQDGVAFPRAWLDDDPSPEPPPRWDEPGDPAPSRPSWGVVAALVGGGVATQRVSDPGTFLADGERSGPVVGGATHGVVLPTWIGGAWDVQLAPGTGWGEVSARGGAALDAGPVAAILGAAVTSALVTEDGTGRTVLVPLPHVGVATLLPVGAASLEVGASGGWMPAAAEVRGRAAVLGGPGLTWSAGLEAGWLGAAFVQPDSGRELTVDRLQGGLSVGVALGG